MTTDRTAATPDLAGRRVLVTGASSGIGAAVARTLTGAGATVALVARRAAELELPAGAQVVEYALTSVTQTSGTQ